MTTLPVDPVILSAVRQAQAALSRYIEPGGPGEATQSTPCFASSATETCCVPRTNPTRSPSRRQDASTNAAYSCSAPNRAAGMSGNGGA
jgi:hypothetical protein